MVNTMNDNTYKFYMDNKATVDEIITAVVSRHPDIIKAKKDNEDHQLKSAFEEFINEFPEEGITSIEDFDNMENATEFLELIKKGLSFNDSYKLCNFAKLMDKGKKSATDTELIKYSSKDHLKPTGKGGMSDSSVPNEVLDLYKALVKDWSEEKIRKHFNKNKSN